MVQLTICTQYILYIFYNYCSNLQILPQVLVSYHPQEAAYIPKTILKYLS